MDAEQERAEELQRHVEVADEMIARRADQLGRPLTKPERAWLVRGSFRWKHGAVLGEQLASVALAEIARRDGGG